MNLRWLCALIYETNAGLSATDSFTWDTNLGLFGSPFVVWHVFGVAHVQIELEVVASGLAYIKFITL